MNPTDTACIACGGPAWTLLAIDPTTETFNIAIGTECPICGDVEK